MRWDMHRAMALSVLVTMCTRLILVPSILGAPGGAAPPFSLELFNGRTMTLADLKGTAVVLLFWTPW